jgi:hypothetical protein
MEKRNNVDARQVFGTPPLVEKRTLHTLVELLFRISNNFVGEEMTSSAYQEFVKGLVGRLTAKEVATLSSKITQALLSFDLVRNELQKRNV